MFFGDSSSVLTPSDPDIQSGSMCVTFWPVSQNPLRSSLKSLSLNQITMYGELSEISLLVLFSRVEISKDIEVNEANFDVQAFLSAFKSEGFKRPISLANNRGFCFFLKGNNATSLSLSRCISFSQVLSARPIKIGVCYKFSKVYSVFPYSTMFSLRFPFECPLLMKPSFLPGLETFEFFGNQEAKLGELKYQKSEKLDKWREHLSEIIPNLFVSSSTIASNASILQQYGITHILNAASHVCESAKGFVQLNFQMNDGGDENVLSYVWKAASFIEDSLNSNGKVLIHCVEGVSRSSAICIGYLIIKRKIDYQTAYKIVRSKRRVVSPQAKFYAQLVQLSEIFGTSSKDSCIFSKEKLVQYEIVQKKDKIIPIPVYKKLSMGDIVGYYVIVDIAKSSISIILNEAITPFSKIALELANDIQRWLNIASSTQKVISKGIEKDHEVDSSSKRRVFESIEWEEIDDFDQEDILIGKVYIIFENGEFSMYVGDGVDEDTDYDEMMKSCCEKNRLEIPSEFPINFPE